MTAPKIRLTRYAQSAGCAAKIAQADLADLLAGLKASTPAPSNLLVSHESGDDAAVLRLRDDLALVETVDIFPPIVDDPFDYGRIAAANALSDIYAMGARPQNALSFVAWPVESLGLDILRQVLAGAADICAQAGIAISGGHSIVDRTPKFGLFVSGTIAPHRLITNAGAQSGDWLVLTKPLGTGVMTTAAKKDAVPPHILKTAVETMAFLNKAAAQAMADLPISAATDVTGFGLLGHLGNLLRASSQTQGTPLGAELFYDEIPVLPHVKAYLEAGLCPGGAHRNLAHAGDSVSFPANLTESDRLFLADPQTSGGLLIAVPESARDALVDALKRAGTPAHAVIGRITQTDHPGSITVV